jgi:hypothetical protein
MVRRGFAEKKQKKWKKQKERKKKQKKKIRLKQYVSLVRRGDIINIMVITNIEMTTQYIQNKTTYTHDDYIVIHTIQYTGLHWQILEYKVLQAKFLLIRVISFKSIKNKFDLL